MCYFKIAYILDLVFICAALSPMFAKEKDTQIVFSGESIKSQQVQSEIECAIACTNVKSCCSINYDTTVRQCSLFYACCPTTEHMNGFTTLIKTPIHERVVIPTPMDCSDLSLGTCSGVYIVRLQNGVNLTVFCDMETDNGGWTVIQNRFDGAVSFSRDWSDYKTGFGDIAGEHWIGNDNLHNITQQNSYKVRFDLEDYSGHVAYAIYDTFYVGDEGSDYLLNIFEYHGTAGDSMKDHLNNPLNGMKFTTHDKDNDIHDYNCGIAKNSGWWHATCTCSNINGIYKEEVSEDSNYWLTFGGKKGLRKTKMMMKPNLEI